MKSTVRDLKEAAGIIVLFFQIKFKQFLDNSEISYNFVEQIPTNPL